VHWLDFNKEILILEMQGTNKKELEVLSLILLDTQNWQHFCNYAKTFNYFIAGIWQSPELLMLCKSIKFTPNGTVLV
jgi:hypothetical protein